MSDLLQIAFGVAMLIATPALENLAFRGVVYLGAVGLFAYTLWSYVSAKQWHLGYFIAGCAVIGAFVATCFVYSLPAKTQEPKLVLLLRYAYNFDHYRGASSTTAAEQNRVVDPSIPLKLQFVPKKPIQFVFGIGNETPAVPIENIYFNMFFNPEDNLIVTAPKEPEGQWSVSTPNHHYLVRLPDITNMAFNAPSLMVTFPKKGTYEFVSDVRVKGLVDGVKTKFKVILY